MLNKVQLEMQIDEKLEIVKLEEEKIKHIETGDISKDIEKLGYIDLARCIDHTLLKPDAEINKIEKLCLEAKKYNFASVCVNSSFVGYAYEQLKDTPVKVCTVIGFPLGTCLSDVKAYEASRALELGAEETDMVINIGRLKNRDYDYVFNDIKAVADAVKGKAILKVIIEISALTDYEKVSACLLAEEAGADFVKTSTGFGTGGATVRDVYLMKKTVGKNVKVKASTGVRTRDIALRMILAGASRFGTSAGIEICKKE